MDVVNKYLAGDLNVYWPEQVHQELANQINQDDSFIALLNYEQKQRLSHIHWGLLNDSQSFIKKIFSENEDLNMVPWINQMCSISNMIDNINNSKNYTNNTNNTKNTIAINSTDNNIDNNLDNKTDKTFNNPKDKLQQYENTFRLFINLSIDFNTIFADHTSVSIWHYLTDQNKNIFLNVVSDQDLKNVKQSITAQKTISFNSYWKTVEKNLKDIVKFRKTPTIYCPKTI